MDKVGKHATMVINCDGGREQ